MFPGYGIGGWVLRFGLKPLFTLSTAQSEPGSWLEGITMLEISDYGVRSEGGQRGWLDELPGPYLGEETLAKQGTIPTFVSSAKEV